MWYPHGRTNGCNYIDYFHNVGAEWENDKWCNACAVRQAQDRDFSLCQHHRAPELPPPLKEKNLAWPVQWSPIYQLSSIIIGCTLDIVTVTPNTDCRLEITGGPLSCSHLSFFVSPPLLPFFSLFVMFSAVPCRQSSLTECLLCYGFIGLVCGRNLWIKVISHCSTFSQAVKLPFTFVPLRERDRERHM